MLGMLSVVSHSTWGLPLPTLVGPFQDGTQWVARYAMHFFRTTHSVGDSYDTETLTKSVVMTRSEFMEWAEHCAPSLHLCLRGMHAVIGTNLPFFLLATFP